MAASTTCRLLFCLLLAACAAPTGTGKNEPPRAAPAAVEPVPAEASWRPAAVADLPGYWESEGITGEAAATVDRIYTLLTPDGHYTSSALLMGARPQFRVVSGPWRLEANVLRLADEREAIQAEVDGNRLRLTTTTGAVTLRRGDR